MNPTPTSSVHSSETAAQDDEINLLDLLQVIADNIKLLTLGPLAVGVTALGISFAIPPTFTAKTQFLPPQQQQSAAASMLASLGALGGLAGAASGLKNPGDQYVAYLKSNSVQDALIERFKLIERYEVDFKDDARKELSNNARITNGKEGLISIEVDDKDPQTSADIANAHIEELGRLMERLAVTEAQQRRLFFEEQLNQTKDRLTEAEQALKATGINSNVIKSSPEAAVQGIAALKANVTAQEVKIASMRGFLTETAPEFKQALNELSALRAQLARAEQEEPASNHQSDYIARYREFKYQETLFELFAKQYELAKVDESREGAVIQVVDQAQAPEHKSKPKKALIAVLATLASGFGLLLFVFFRQALRNASQSPESSTKMVQIKASFRRAFSRS
jgi:uncharacterized protein involved in exopolysaccharide biosynthesis